MRNQSLKAEQATGPQEKQLLLWRQLASLRSSGKLGSCSGRNRLQACDLSWACIEEARVTPGTLVSMATDMRRSSFTYVVRAIACRQSQDNGKLATPGQGYSTKSCISHVHVSHMYIHNITHVHTYITHVHTHITHVLCICHTRYRLHMYHTSHTNTCTHVPHMSHTCDIHVTRCHVMHITCISHHT